MKKLSRKEAEKVLEDMKVKIEIPKAAVTQWKRNTALDMAIEALKYSGVPNSSDCINRQAALDAMDTWDKFGCNPDGKLVRYDDDDHYVPYVRYDDMVHAIKHLPPTEAENIEEFKKNLSRVINVGIVATNTKDDVYSCGMRNGMRWCRSLLEDEPPKFEDASVYVQPTVDTIPVVRCADCIWMQCNAKPDGTLPKGVDEYECRHWCGACDPTDFCSRGERKDSERHDD